MMYPFVPYYAPYSGSQFYSKKIPLNFMQQQSYLTVYYKNRSSMAVADIIMFFGLIGVAICPKLLESGSSARVIPTIISLIIPASIWLLYFALSIGFYLKTRKGCDQDSEKRYDLALMMVSKRLICLFVGIIACIACLFTLPINSSAFVVLTFMISQSTLLNFFSTMDPILPIYATERSCENICLESRLRLLESSIYLSIFLATIVTFAISNTRVSMHMNLFITTYILFAAAIQIAFLSFFVLPKILPSPVTTRFVIPLDLLFAWQEQQEQQQKKHGLLELEPAAAAKPESPNPHLVDDAPTRAEQQQKGVLLEKQFSRIKIT